MYVLPLSALRLALVLVGVCVTLGVRYPFSPWPCGWPFKFAALRLALVLVGVCVTLLSAVCVNPSPPSQWPWVWPSR